MLLRIVICLAVLFSCCADAGQITVEKNDSVILNELFNQKRHRAEEYLRHEEQRKADSENWSYRLVPECLLLTGHYLIYSCADGDYYKAYEAPHGLQYRRLSEEELKKLPHKRE